MPIRPSPSSAASQSIRPRSLFLACALGLAVVAASFGAPPAAASDRVVVVQAGQTLTQIAAAHGTTVERLVALNHLADPNRIYAGQRIRVRAAAPAKARGRPAHHARPVLHRITFGETLTAIAARYGTTIDALVNRNHLADPSRIYTGQVLRISGGHRQARRARGESQPGRSAHRARRVRTVIHIVRAGETLSGIAVRYRVGQDAIASANELANPSLIRSGQQLRIPGAQRQLPPRARHRRAPTSRPAMPASMASLVRQRQGVRLLIAKEARRQRVPRALALAVAWQESGWQERVVSSAGAIGVMQLLPATADWVSASMLGEPVNLWNARSNARAGVALLKHYLARYGNRPLALAAYYQGQAGTDRHGIYPVSRPYIDAILQLERLFGG